LASSNPMLWDLKVTSDFTRMRGRGGGGSKARRRSRFFEHGTVAATLALSRNGSKCRPLGREAALYNQVLALQWASGPRGLSGANFGNPTVWCLQWIFRPTALFGLTATWQ
jgi:hypothetical protein